MNETQEKAAFDNALADLRAAVDEFAAGQADRITEAHATAQLARHRWVRAHQQASECRMAGL